MASRWTGSLPLTMSSREIAELTGKAHRNVMRDIRVMLQELFGDVGLLKFEHTEVNEQNGTAYPVFVLPKRETLILVSGYSIELRARIIDRWQELEAQQGPKLPTTMAESWCAQHSIRLPICLHGLPFGDVNLLVSPRR